MSPIMRFCLLFFTLTKTSALNVLSRAIPTTFWLLQGEGEDMSTDVALCAKCCKSADAAALEESLGALTATGRVAVEIEPLALPGDPPSTVAASTTPIVIGNALAEEITSGGPRSFLFPGGMLARVNEFDFEDGGTGSRVWDAAIAMSVWITRHADRFRGKSVLELGAGTGLCGICAALSGADATLSDMAGVDEPTASAALAGGSAAAVSTAALLPNIEANARLNGLADDPDETDRTERTARTLPLDWESCFGAEPTDLYDVVIGSDVVYEGFAITALAAAMIAHTAPGGAAYLMSARSRWDDASGALLVLLKAQGTIDLESFTIHNSFGRSELVLATWTKARESRSCD